MFFVRVIVKVVFNWTQALFLYSGRAELFVHTNLLKNVGGEPSGAVVVFFSVYKTDRKKAV